MTRFGSRIVGLGVFTACLALGGAAARADLTTSFVSVTPVAGGFDWQYRVNLDSIQRIDTGITNFVTIYDFGPNTLLVPLPNFTYLSTLTNTPAFQTTPVDNPNILNVRFTYTGATNIVGPQTIGFFDLFSPNGPSRTVSTDGQAMQIGVPPDTDQLRGNVSSTIAPVPVPAAGAGLPGLVAACGGLIALARRRRRQEIA
jgi:hypothetical protein